MLYAQGPGESWSSSVLMLRFSRDIEFYEGLRCAQHTPLNLCSVVVSVCLFKGLTEKLMIIVCTFAEYLSLARLTHETSFP